jgi:hypothetical protein
MVAVLNGQTVQRNVGQYLLGISGAAMFCNCGQSGWKPERP